MGNSPAVAVNPFTGGDVAGILAERDWVVGDLSPQQRAWCEHAAAILGPQAADRNALADLLGLVFQYDAREILGQVESHAVLSRYAARDVVRQLALLLLEGAPLDSERFKEIVTALKEHTAKKDYDQITSAQEFARRVTADMQAVANDKHLRMNYGIPAPQGPASPEDRERMHYVMS